MYPLTSNPSAAQAIARQMIEERGQQAEHRAQVRAARNARHETRREARRSRPSSTEDRSAWALRFLRLAH